MTTATSSQLHCVECNASAASVEPDFRCSACRGLLEWQCPEPVDPFDTLRKLWLKRRASFESLDQSGVWRFREILPALASEPITLREGNTPLYELRGCARSAGVDRLYAKHQGMNPTGSFKDTGMTVAASFAREQKFRWVACASTGNTSASVAAYAAYGGMRSLVLIPEGKISWGKLSQALDYGAVTCQLKTDFDGCLSVLTEVVRRAPVYLLNSVNPYRIEGQKTAATELLERLSWQVPDHVIVPGGNLGNCSALGKAFLEMKRWGWISCLPKISVIQAEGANPFYIAIRQHGGTRLMPVAADTIATAIRIGNPASWKKAAGVVAETGGEVEQASDAEIALAKSEIGSDGIGCEPASAVTLAGLKKLVRRGFIRRNQSVILILTGHLLKDPEFTLNFHRGELFSDAESISTQRHAPIKLDPTADAVLRVLNQHK